MKRSVVELFNGHGTLIDKDVVDYILSLPEPEEYVQRISGGVKQFPLFLSLGELHKLEMDLKILPRESTSAEVRLLSGLAELAHPRAGEALDRSVHLADTKGLLPDISSRSPTLPAGAFAKSPSPVPKPPAPGRTPRVALPPRSPASGASSPTKSSPAHGDPRSQGGTNSKIPRRSIGGVYRPFAKEYDPEVLVRRDLTGNSTCEGQLEDFSLYFNARFEDIKRLLRNGRSNMAEVVTIKRAKRAGGKVTTVGMVASTSTTKNGHRMLVIEDDTDEIRCLINKGSPLFGTVVVEDEVLGIIGSLSSDKNMLFIDELVRPEVPFNREPNRARVELSVAFVSDVHIGSDTFLSRNWEHFIKWINGKSDKQALRDTASHVKYLVLPGDLVDGIGVYPNQINELEITDINVQYEAFASEMMRIPDHIEIIAQPGNHDAVRLAEPQPALPQEIQELFERNVRFLGNPSSFSLHGVDVLSYHGKSMDDFIQRFPGLTYDRPLDAMEEMLRRRHLLPMYGMKTPIAPEHSDMLFIDKVPDIFVTGHVHSAGAKEYRGMALINASTWQSQTSYQKMLNFIPDPCKVPVVGLSSGNVMMLDFSTA